MVTDTFSAADPAYTEQLSSWIEFEKSAVRLLAATSNLSFNHSVDLVLFRNPLRDKSVSELLNLHKYAADFVGRPINVEDTSDLADEMLRLELAPSKIDIGKLASEWHAEKASYGSKAEFIADKLKSFMYKDNGRIAPVDVVLYGFGRIGRLLARELVLQAGKGDQLRLKAIVTRSVNEEQIAKRAALLRMDSVHGPFPGTVKVDGPGKALVINGQLIKMVESNAPDDIDYTKYGINNALVIDNTGKWRNKEALSLHLKSKGASRVLLTAPGQEVPNIVFGVNEGEFDIDKEKIFSAASCTTNAIVPILKVVDGKWGIKMGHMETVHAYTNDQNLLDNFHKKNRRGRAAAVNMVITETGAAKAAVKVLPNLINKLTASAVRVPTPDGSLAIMHLTVDKKTTREEVNEVFKDAALHGPLVEQIKYSMEEELVSNDIVGSITPAVFDSPATIVSHDGQSMVLYVWYDNEFGYVRQVAALAKYVTKVRRKSYF